MCIFNRQQIESGIAVLSFQVITEWESQPSFTSRTFNFTWHSNATDSKSSCLLIPFTSFLSGRFLSILKQIFCSHSKYFNTFLFLNFDEKLEETWALHFSKVVFHWKVYLAFSTNEFNSTRSWSMPRGARNIKEQKRFQVYWSLDVSCRLNLPENSILKSLVSHGI